MSILKFLIIKKKRECPENTNIQRKKAAQVKITGKRKLTLEFALNLNLCVLKSEKKVGIIFHRHDKIC